MGDHLSDFNRVFVLVSINFALGVGVGVQMAGPYELRLTVAISAGAVVCLTIAAIIYKVVVEERPG